MSIRTSRRLSFLAVSDATSGDSTLVTVPANIRFVVVNYALVADSAVDVTFKSGSTAVTGPFGLGANGGVSFPGTIDGPAFVGVAAGDDLVLNTSGNVQVSGHLSYFLELV